MSRRLKATWLAILLAVASLAGSVPANASTSVFTGGVQVNGPLVVNSDGGHVGLLITGKQNSTFQEFEVDDYLHAPIFSVPPFGGPAVFGDNFRVFAPTQVFNQAFTIWLDGSISLGQTQSNGVDQGGVTFYSGSADPNVSPPVHMGHGFEEGDRYFRSNGGIYAWLDDVWVNQLGASK